MRKYVNLVDLVKHLIFTRRYRLRHSLERASQNLGGDSIHLFNSLPTVWRRNGHRVRACRLLFLACRRWLKLDVRPASQPAQGLALRNGLPLLLHSTHSSQCIFRAFQLSSRSSSTKTLIGWNLSTATTRRVHRCNTGDVTSSLD